MVDLYSIFCRIEPAESNEKSFPAEEIISTLPHRLGCSQERYPIFFVECCDEMPTTNINLKQFSVNFNQVCNLVEGGNTICKKYTIILLKSLESDIQKYFLDLVYIVLRKLPSKPTVAALKQLDLTGKKVVAILSGGNMDVITMSSVVQQGLILRDRIFTVSVLLPDKPGELSRVSGVVAHENGNVIKLEHNQFVSINRNAAVELRITLEAFGTEHKNQIVQALEVRGYRPRVIRVNM